MSRVQTDLCVGMFEQRDQRPSLIVGTPLQFFLIRELAARQPIERAGVVHFYRLVLGEADRDVLSDDFFDREFGKLGDDRHFRTFAFRSASASPHSGL